MIFSGYLCGKRSLWDAVMLNIVALLAIGFAAQYLVSNNIIPNFAKPGSVYEIVLFLMYCLVVLGFDFVVWRCADNASKRIYVYLGRLFALKNVILLVIMIVAYVGQGS